jgi:hypothetical protein
MSLESSFPESNSSKQEKVKKGTNGFANGTFASKSRAEIGALALRTT